MVNGPAIGPLAAEDAARLAGLMTAYRRAMGGPAAPMATAQAAGLIARAALDPDLLLLRAGRGDALSGFALAFDLPEIISGRRAGQLDDLFVAPEARGGGIARALLGHLAGIGTARGWTHLRWLVPRDNAAAKRFYQSVADPAPWDSFRIALTT